MDDKPTVCPRCKSANINATMTPRWGFTDFTYEKWQTFVCENCHMPFSIIIKKIEKDSDTAEVVAPDGSILEGAISPKEG